MLNGSMGAAGMVRLYERARVAESGRHGVGSQSRTAAGKEKSRLVGVIQFCSPAVAPRVGYGELRSNPSRDKWHYGADDRATRARLLVSAARPWKTSTRIKRQFTAPALDPAALEATQSPADALKWTTKPCL